MVEALKMRSARAIRRALLRGIGVALVAVGVGFLASAGWILLAEAYSNLFASLIMGGIFLGLGLIFLGVASSSKDRREDIMAEAAAAHDPAAPPSRSNMSPLAEAFIIGLNAAHAARGRR
ncbi:hypothetical protein V8352_03410 [Roseovarius sp. D0-M9]